jgi:hypothetical protein
MAMTTLFGDKLGVGWEAAVGLEAAVGFEVPLGFGGVAGFRVAATAGCTPSGVDGASTMKPAASVTRTPMKDPLRIA